MMFYLNPSKTKSFAFIILFRRKLKGAGGLKSYWFVFNNDIYVFIFTILSFGSLNKIEIFLLYTFDSSKN